MLPIIDPNSPDDSENPVEATNAWEITPFGERVGENAERPMSGLTRNALTQLQVNLGKLCNQACTHCHVDAGPTKRRENMSAAVADRIIELASQSPTLQSVDLTGGAPEMNPNFRRMVTAFRSAGLEVIDRCNLTILTQPGFEWVADFLAEQEVHVIASLPCYLEDNVDAQRGNGVFQQSIDGLRMLNARQYREPGSPRSLDLVFNPTSPSLPPDQASLEADYRRELKTRFDIEFGHLLTITNIPIRRYAQFLRRKGQLDEYMRLLHDHFNTAAVSQVMCRHLVSISWDGRIYDCDFNQMIDLAKDSQTVWSIDSLDTYIGRRIDVDNHCYGCTAGTGSSCGGALLSS